MMNQRISSRNNDLDLLKGIACVAMIVAHARTIGVAIDSPLSIISWQLSLFAPVIFFFTLGITMWYQVKSRGRRSVIVSSGVLGLLSMVDVGRTSAAYLSYGGIHLFGGLAFSTLITLMIPTQGLILFFAMIVIVIADRVFGRIGVSPSIFTGQLFSIIPWSAYLLFGSIYHFDRKLFRTITAGIWVLTIIYLIRSPYVLSTQDSSTGYMAIGCSLCSLLIWTCKLVSPKNGVARFLAWIGRHSLVFYWVHLTILYAIPGRHTATIVWGSTLILTCAVLAILDWMKRHLTFISTSPSILMLVVLAIPVPVVFDFPAYLRTIWCTLTLIVLAVYLKDLCALGERGLLWLSQQVTNATRPNSQS